MSAFQHHALVHNNQYNTISALCSSRIEIQTGSELWKKPTASAVHTMQGMADRFPSEAYILAVREQTVPLASNAVPGVSKCRSPLKVILPRLMLPRRIRAR